MTFIYLVNSDLSIIFGGKYSYMTGELKKQKIAEWEKHSDIAGKKAFYSIQRIDLLVISISGACIYIAFEILRFVNSGGTALRVEHTWLLKASAIFAVLAIGINFISQITGYKANKNEEIYARGVIECLKHDKEDTPEMDRADNCSFIYNKITSIANIVATVLMFTGIVLLVIFNLVTF